MTLNYWERFADERMSSPRKAQLRGIETRRQKALDKKKEDDDILHRQWKKWSTEKLAELLSGEYGAEAQKLFDFVGGMSLMDAAELIERVEDGPWASADNETRLRILTYINRSIVHLRESAGLAPFDDPLPGDEPNAFLILRELLKPSRIESPIKRE